MVAVALGVLATVSLTACGDDDDDAELKKAASVKVEYNVTLSEDIIKYYDVEVNYLGNEGKVVQNAQVPTRTWKGYKGSSSTLPVKVFYTFNFIKNDKEFSGKINLSYNSEVTITVYNKDGKKLRSKTYTAKTENTGIDPNLYSPSTVLDQVKFEYTVPADGKLEDIK